MNFEKLKGIDTIAYGIVWGPKANALLDLRKDSHSLVYPIVTIRNGLNSGFASLFSNTEAVRLVSLDARPSLLDTNKENVLIAHIGISTRMDSFLGEDVKVANVSVSLERRVSGKGEIIYHPDITYPFIVPDTQEKLEQKISDGIQYLFNFLPKYVRCANLKNPSPACLSDENKTLQRGAP
jgi:hypothetical protein